MAKTICAWCGDVLHDGCGPISHGICGACSASLLSDQKGNLGRYLDLLDEPVAVVDGDVTVIAANGHLRRLVNRAAEELRELKAGEVLECAHARLPGGCGRTVFCTSCAIRSSVTETLASGRCVIAAPAALSRASGEEVRLRITTERVGEAVLLQIEGVAGAVGKQEAD